MPPSHDWGSPICSNHWLRRIKLKLSMHHLESFMLCGIAQISVVTDGWTGLDCPNCELHSKERTTANESTINIIIMVNNNIRRKRRKMRRVGSRPSQGKGTGSTEGIGGCTKGMMLDKKDEVSSHKKQKEDEGSSSSDNRSDRRGRCPQGVF